MTIRECSWVLILCCVLARGAADESLTRRHQLFQVCIWVLAIDCVARYIVLQSEFVQLLRLLYLLLIALMLWRGGSCVVGVVKVELGRCRESAFGRLRNAIHATSISLNHSLLRLSEDILLRVWRGRSSLSIAWMSPLTASLVLVADLFQFVDVWF